MLVRQVMIKKPLCCGESLNVAAAAEVLRVDGAGALPVIDLKGMVSGILTGHDIILAAGRQNKRLSEMTATEIMTRNPWMCRADDDVHTALRTMRLRKVWQLPVVNAAGELEGLLRATDVVIHARNDDGSRPDLSYADAMNTLKSIYEREPELEAILQ